jgi:DNA-directed RNA polymerase sigma subunit (sigma70/sigma32)
MKRKMTNNSEARRRLKLGTQISQALIPLRSRPEVGKILGMSAEHVRQVECAALQKIAARLGINLQLDTREHLDIDWRKI